MKAISTALACAVMGSFSISGAAEPAAPTEAQVRAALEHRRSALEIDSKRYLRLPGSGEIPTEATVGVMVRPFPGLYRVRYSPGSDKDPVRRAELSLLDSLATHWPISRRREADGTLEYRMHWSAATPVTTHVAQMGPSSIISITRSKARPSNYDVFYNLEVRKWFNGFEGKQDLQAAARAYRDTMTILGPARQELRYTKWGWRSNEVAPFAIVQQEPNRLLDLRVANEVLLESVKRGTSRLPLHPCLALPDFTSRARPDNELQVTDSRSRSAEKVYAATLAVERGSAIMSGESRFAKMLVKHGIIQARTFEGSPLVDDVDSPSVLGGVRLMVSPALQHLSSKIEPNSPFGGYFRWCLEYAQGAAQIVAIQEAPIVTQDAAKELQVRTPSYIVLGRLEPLKLFDWMKKLIDSGDVPEAEAVAEGIPFTGRITYVDDKWTWFSDQIHLPESVVPYDNQLEQIAVNIMFDTIAEAQLQQNRVRMLLDAYRLISEGKNLQHLSEEDLSFVVGQFAEWRASTESYSGLCSYYSQQFQESMNKATPFLKDPLLAGVGARAIRDLKNLAQVQSAQCRPTLSMIAVVRRNSRFDPARIRAESPVARHPAGPVNVRPISGRSYSVPPPENATERSRAMEGRRD